MTNIYLLNIYYMPSASLTTENPLLIIIEISVLMKISYWGQMKY